MATIDATPSAVTKSYVICTTARSGSNLFCDHLRNTGLLGQPAEALNPDLVRSGLFKQRFQFEDSVSTTDYLAWLKETMVTPNGVFGVKLLFEDLHQLGGFAAVEKLLGDSKLIFLRRRSKVRQAISYFVAESTGQWVHYDPPKKAIEDVEFNFTRLDHIYNMLVWQESMWLTYFERWELSFQEVIFEDFLLDPATYLRNIASSMGVDVTAAPVRATLKEQKTPRSAEFLEQFLKQKQIVRHGAETIYKQLRFVP